MASNNSGFGSKTEEKRQNMRGSNSNSAYNNPCIKEHKMSLDCLAQNAYQHDKCQLQFANYKACKAFWNNVRWERKMNGIYPHLPDPEEREKIQAEFFAKNKS